MSCCIIGCPNEGVNASKETTYHLFPHPTKGKHLSYNLLKNVLFKHLVISDLTRFEKWLEACCNPRIEQLDRMLIHKRHRVCRRHFDTECFNGGCRRLLNTAIPSLYLYDVKPLRKSKSRSLANDIDLLPQEVPIEEITYVPIALDEDNSDEHGFELFVATVPETSSIRGKLALIVITETYLDSILTGNSYFSRFSLITLFLAKQRVSVKRKSPEILNTQTKRTVNKYGYLRDIHSYHLSKKQKIKEEQTEIGIYYKIICKFPENL